MLDTLLKIGEWQSRGKTKWDRFFNYDTPDREDRHGNPIENYTLQIIFDLDDGQVIINSSGLSEYDEGKIKDTLPFKVKGGNNKSIYTSVPGGKLNQLYKTFFGKEGEDTECGQLKEAMEKLNIETEDGIFEKILAEIFELKDQFIGLANNPDKDQIDIRAINELLDLGRNENLEFVVAHLKAEKYGFNEATPFASVPAYFNFVEQSYFGDQDESGTEPNSESLCYASGNIQKDVGELDLSSRYSLNKMFVTETKNYATQFNRKRFNLNYQVSAVNQEKLDYASKYLLHEGYKVRIAGVDHVIVPQFLSNSEIQLENALKGINKKSDLLFNLKALYEQGRVIDEGMDDTIFWVNFIAFESDGNFFKSTELIKDVSNYHLTRIVKLMHTIEWELRDAGYVDFDSVMMEYDYNSKKRISSSFNFNSLYKLIPIRKDKEKKNKALDLLKSILENRAIDKSLLFEYFKELILCHWYERYGSYNNISPSTTEYFYFSVRNSVFKYLAFFKLLKNLKLINMEETNQEMPESTGNKYEDAEQAYFYDMDMNNRIDQQAMFYLGRILSSVEWIQIEKKIKKTVIHLVNFNGMEKDSIVRLRNDLINKARQHNELGKVKFLNGLFGDKFNYNSWNMNPNEALFFLLTGYSFRTNKKESEEQSKVEKIEN